MEGRTDRGGPTPARVDRRQGQYRDQRASPPPTITILRGDGQARGSTAPPSATHARGDGSGLTARQQQPPTDLSRHAFSLYRQCVAAGQWARVSVENRSDGQYFTLACRPMAAAPAAGAAEGAARRRRPNQRRKEKKQLWLRSRQQQPLQATVAAAADLGSYAHVAARAASKHCLVAAAAPTAPAVTTTAVAAPSCSPAASSSPMLTRARKRRKQDSPGATSAVVQLDGAEQTPPSSPPVPFSPVSPPRLAALSSLDVLASPMDPDVMPSSDEPANDYERLSAEAPTTTSACLEAAGPIPVNPPPPSPPVLTPDKPITQLSKKLDRLHDVTHLTFMEDCDRCTKKFSVVE